jgi:hypothetical protein
MEPIEHPEQVQNLLAGYILGDLTPKEAAQVTQLLEHSPDLLTELHQLQSTLAVLSLSLPVACLPQQLEARILQAAQAEDFPTAHSPAKQIRQSRPRPWKWGIAIAAVMIAGLGSETYRLHQKLAMSQLENRRLYQQMATLQATLGQIRQNEVSTTRQELSRYQEAVNLLRQPNNRFLTLKGTGSTVQSSGSLVLVPTKDSAILVLRDVALLSEGKVYRLWALVNGQKVSCADFKPNAQGEVFLQLALNQWGGTTEVVVTVEPDRAMSMPVGEMVITGRS